MKIEIPISKSLIFIAIAGVFSAFFMGSLNLLFLIPLHFLASKYGRQEFLFGSGIALTLGLLIEIFRGLSIDILIPLGLLAGLLLLNLAPFKQGWLNLVVALLLSAGGTLLVLLLPGRNALISNLMEFMSASPETQELLSAIIPGTGLEEQVTFIIDILLRSLLLSAALVQLLACFIGRTIARGIRSWSGRRLEFPVWFIWIFIFSILAIMIGETQNILFFAYAGWNCLLLCSLLYFLKGLGILARFVRNKSLLPVLLILAIIIPVANMVFSIGLIILGIASIWIPMLESERKNENESNSEY